MNRPSSEDATPACSRLAETGCETTVEGDEPCFDWAALVPLTVHPMRVAIIEALWWIGEPLSAKDLREVFADEKLGTSYISYHVAELAKAGALVKVGEEPKRGAVKKLYFFPPAK
ncbi:MAG TPA: helix-turn-helix domain-containing protein [Solirubrobacterales bacterium]|nr:helix-turn-helix domain-containing protein [Solirubrobacterales bacterium]